MSERLEVRPPRRDEARAIVRMLNEHSRRLHGRDETTLDDVLTWFGAPSLNVEEDVRIAVARGRIAGYADVQDDGGAHRRFWADVRVADPGQEIARALLAAVERRARQLALPGALLRRRSLGVRSPAVRGVAALDVQAAFRPVALVSRGRGGRDRRRLPVPFRRGRGSEPRVGGRSRGETAVASPRSRACAPAACLLRVRPP